MLSYSRFDPISSLYQNVGMHWPALYNTKKGVPVTFPGEESLRYGRTVAKNSRINCNTTGPYFRSSKLTGLYYKQTNAQFRVCPRSSSTLPPFHTLRSHFYGDCMLQRDPVRGINRTPKKSSNICLCLEYTTRMGPCTTSFSPTFQPFVQPMISYDTFVACALVVAPSLSDLAIPNASKTSISVAIRYAQSFFISKRSSKKYSKNS